MKDHDSLARRASHGLHQLMRGLRLHSLGHWSPALEGLSALDLGLIRAVAQAKGSAKRLAVGEVRERLDIPKSTLTSAINRLEDKGLLRRTMHPADRRSYGLELTDAGWKVDEEHQRVDALLGTKVMGCLDSDAEREALAALLSKVGSRL